MKKKFPQETIMLPSVRCGGPDDNMHRLIRDLCYAAFMVHTLNQQYAVDREKVKHYAVALAHEWNPEKYIRTVIQRVNVENESDKVSRETIAHQVGVIHQQNALIAQLREQLAKSKPNYTVQQLRAARKAVKAASKILS